MVVAKHQKTCLYFKEQNSTGERINRIILELVRCSLIDSGLDNRGDEKLQKKIRSGRR